MRTTVGRRIDVRLDRPLPYELDGGAAPEAQEAEDQGAARLHPRRGAGPVSTATKVPETYELDRRRRRETLRRIGAGRLLADAWMRLRVSDGFSHARSLAYTISLVLVQAIIGVIGLITAFGSADAHGTIVRTVRAAVPGPGRRHAHHRRPPGPPRRRLGPVRGPGLRRRRLARSPAPR